MVARESKHGAQTTNICAARNDNLVVCLHGDSYHFII